MVWLRIFWLYNGTKAICMQVETIIKILNFDFLLLVICNIILSHNAGQGQPTAAPSQPLSREGKQLILYSVLCCQCFLDIVFYCFHILSCLQNALLCLLLLVRRGRQLLLRWIFDLRYFQLMMGLSGCNHIISWDSVSIITLKFIHVQHVLILPFIAD